MNTKAVQIVKDALHKEIENAYKNIKECQELKIDKLVNYYEGAISATRTSISLLKILEKYL